MRILHKCFCVRLQKLRPSNAFLHHLLLGHCFHADFLFDFYCRALASMMARASHRYSVRLQLKVKQKEEARVLSGFPAQARQLSMAYQCMESEHLKEHRLCKRLLNKKLAIFKAVRDLKQKQKAKARTHADAESG